MNSDYEVPLSELSTDVHPPQQLPALIVSGEIDMPHYCSLSPVVPGSQFGSGIVYAWDNSASVVL